MHNTLHETTFFHEKFLALNDGVQRLLSPIISGKYNGERVLNGSGDLRYVAATYGADISVQRSDLLDEMAAHFVDTQVFKGVKVKVIEIGGGIGAQSLRLAAVGAHVKMVDLTDQGQAEILSSDNLNALSALTGSKGGAVIFINKDVRDVVERGASEKYQVVFSQRMWSSMPYHNARDVLDALAGSTEVFFVSAIGLDTEFGPTYPHRDRPVRERWSFHGPEMAEKHGVKGFECLYRESDLRQQFEDVGLKVIHTYSSTFGNPRIIATHPSIPKDTGQIIESLVNSYC